MARRPSRGNGMIRARGGRFQATIQVDGRRLWETFEKEADAWAWLATVKADAVRGVLKVEKKTKEMRFDDLARLYRIHKERTWRAGTVQFFDCHAKGVLLPSFGRRLIAHITPAEIQTFLDQRLEVVSAMTVTKAQQILCQLFNYGVRMGYLPTSPLARVERIKATPSIRRVLRLHELQAILKACPEQHAPFFTILALTGLRRSELFRLSWDWCDFEREMLIIKEAKRGANEMPMSPRVKAALMRLGPDSVGRVFPGYSRGERASERGDAWKLLTSKTPTLKRVLAAAGLDPTGIGFHTFRHTFITLIERLPGVSYSVVRALARHGSHSGDITARYLHPSDEQLRQALGQLEEQVFGPTKVVLLPRQALA